MAVLRPYRRTCRQFIEGSYGGSGNWAYILHKKYAKSPEQYIRAFLLLQKDLHNLFDYIEPSDQNLAWDSGGALPWYKAYNETKHNRHDSFKMATFEHMHLLQKEEDPFQSINFSILA